MADISQVVNSTSVNASIGAGKNSETSSSPTTTESSSSGGEINRTDPKVCHDPSLSFEGIVRMFSNQNKVEMEDGELSTNNEYEMTKVDGIEYPLIAINDRNIENNAIIYMKIDYTRFLPTIMLKIIDDHENEQKINTSQMSSIIRVCMISRVDKVYRKFLLNFRTYDVRIDDADPTDVTYYGTFYIPGFRQINMRHIWMPVVCGGKNCNQGAHINANTWEMLHRIAELSGLGFAATKKCKEIEDRVIRNIYSQRFDQYVEEQLTHCGLTEENIFDAWVDFYGYIVMVNVPWIMDEQITADELKITANIGIHGTSNDVTEQTPEIVNRTLTNYNLMGSPSNMEIASFNMVVDNDSVKHGTLEKVYTQSIASNITELNNIDVQSKQDSVDGDFIEDYNTGKNRPIPKYYFNDDAYTGLSGGYNLHEQKVIRNAYFRKKRQSILNVELKNINLGLQRGTLVDIAIFDNDIENKKKTFADVNNLTGASGIEDSHVDLPPEINQEDILLDDGAYMPNVKLSGLYYIDGMQFEYSKEDGRIIQTINLMKKGKTSGYSNKHTSPRVPDAETPMMPTLSQSGPFLIPS